MRPGRPLHQAAAQCPAAVLVEAAHEEAADEWVQAAVEAQQRQAEGVQDVERGGGATPVSVVFPPSHLGRQQQVVGRQTEGEDQQEPQDHGLGRAPVRAGGCRARARARAQARGRLERPRQAHVGREHQQEGGREGHRGGGQPRACPAVLQAGRGQAPSQAKAQAARAGRRRHRARRAAALGPEPRTKPQRHTLMSAAKTTAA